MSLQELVWHVAPFFAFLQKPLRRWYDIATPAGQEHVVTARLRQRYAEAYEWRECASALRAFSDRLREEHARLETVENKSRAVLAAASLLVALGAFVSASTLQLPSVTAVQYVVRLMSLLGLIYLASAVLAALFAGKIGVRWYVDPPDLVNAKLKIESKEMDTDVLLAAVMMTYKDQMAESTELKLRALMIANLSLRNGLVVTTFVVVTQVLVAVVQ